MVNIQQTVLNSDLLISSKESNNYIYRIKIQFLCQARAGKSPGYSKNKVCFCRMF